MPRCWHKVRNCIGSGKDSSDCSKTLSIFFSGGGKSLEDGRLFSEMSGHKSRQRPVLKSSLYKEVHMQLE